MNSVAGYVLFLAVVGVPLIALYPDLREALFALFRLSSSMIGTAWP
jgi:hypothetical protein